MRRPAVRSASLRRLGVIAAAALAALAACGGSSAAPGAYRSGNPPAYAKTSCADTFKEGAKANLDSSGDWDPTCTENGKIVVGFTEFKVCSDGSRVSWTDRAWEKDGVVHTGAADLSKVCP